MADTLLKMLPTLVPIAAGYALARYFGVSASPLRTTARYALVPPLIFALLTVSFRTETTTTLALTGAAMAMVMVYALGPIMRATKLNLDAGVTLPSVAVMALPVLHLSWGAKTGKAAVAIIFVAAALAWTIAQNREKSLKVLMKEPWAWAALGAVAVRLLGVDSKPLYDTFSSLADAAYPLCLVYLGTMLDFADLKDRDAWIGSLVRIGLCVAVAIASVKLFPVKGFAAVTVIAGMAVPSSPGAALVKAGDKDGISSAALLASLIGIVVLDLGKWFD